MSPGARSIVAWTGYVMTLGAGLLLIPNVILSIFGIEETDEVWIRIAGLLLLGYGLYYWTAVRHELGSLFEMSVWVRWGIAVGLVVLAFTTGPWQLVLFAAVDALGGAWTYVALRQRSPQAST